jgi:hypothetical protein
MPDDIAPVAGWDGFQDPNYTPVPDDFFDVLLAHLTDVEVRVLLYIIRRTYGFKKPADDISLSQIVKGIVTRDGRRLDYGAGVSKAGAVLAVKRLEARGILFAQRNESPERGHEATTYRLRKAGAGLATPQPRLDYSADKGSPPPEQGLVYAQDTQETAVQNTEYKNGSDPALLNMIRTWAYQHRIRVTPEQVQALATAAGSPARWQAVSAGAGALQDVQRALDGSL